ncbi:MAG: hypothetical protein AAGH15_03340 [Myxococcota bacterium]
MRSLAPLALVFASLGCGGEEAPAPPAPVLPAVPPVASPGATPQPIAPEPVAPAAPESNFGTLTLAAGFTPDPHTASGTSGGTVEAKTLNGACLGWVSERPDHLLELSTDFPTFRLMVNAGTVDTTLVVQRPDGSYLCNDDGEGINPIVTGSFNPGTHKVWVGSYERGQNAEYVLGLSELNQVVPSSLAGPAGSNVAAAGPSNFGTVALAPGFVPDPHVVNGTSGGSRDASTLGEGCTGQISATPDHVLAASGDFPTLRILVSAGANDTTLVVENPDGTYLCNDDGVGSDPLIEAPLPAGNYKVWVGTVGSDANFPYRLGFSELASTTPASLGG